MNETEDYCLFCRAVLSPNIKVDIQFSTTRQGNLNVEEFIKLQVLNIRLNCTLDGQFLCNVCFDVLNTLEDFLLQSKNIQDKLQDDYNRNKAYEKQKPPGIICMQTQETKECLGVDTEHADDANHTNSNMGNVTDTNDTDEKTPKIIKKKAKSLTGRPKSKTSNMNVKKINKWKSKIHAQDTLENEDVAVDDVNSEEKQKLKWCCEVCGKITNRANAAKHMNIHTKEQLFLCEYCNKNFTQKVDLKRHINIHMGIFPYVCEFCGKKFAQHTSYDIHKKNHLGKRDFKCIICEKGMLSKSHLVRHMKTHTNEKSYGCEICGKVFAERYNMTSHMKKVHMREPSQVEVVESTNSNEMQCEVYDTVNDDTILIYKTSA